jgi:hypothetical protein
MVDALLLPFVRVIVLVWKLQAAPTGRELQLSEMLLLKTPFIGYTLTAYTAANPADTVMLEGVTGANPKADEVKEAEADTLVVVLFTFVTVPVAE